MTVLFPGVKVRVAGEDDNAFVVLAAVEKALKKAGEPEAAEAFFEEAVKGNFAHMMATAKKYVEVV